MSNVFYKTMLSDYYKQNKILNSNEYNYGLIINQADETDITLSDIVLQASHRSKLPFYILFLVAQKSQEKHIPIDLITAKENNDINLELDLGDLYNNIPMKNYINAGLLSHVVTAGLHSKTEIGSPLQNVIFWEYLYELVRSNKFPEKPSRKKSFFACKTEQDLEKYKDRHGLGRFDCKIAVEEKLSIFEGDLTLLDNIAPDYNFEEAFHQTVSYWCGEKSDDPLIEVLIQGTFRLL